MSHIATTVEHEFCNTLSQALRPCSKALDFQLLRRDSRSMIQKIYSIIPCQPETNPKPHAVNPKPYSYIYVCIHVYVCMYVCMYVQISALLFPAKNRQANDLIPAEQVEELEAKCQEARLRLR